MEDIMTRIVALGLTVMLVFTGCAPRRMNLATQSNLRLQAGTSRASTVERDPEDWRRYIANLPVGTTLTIDLADGARVTGVILGVEQDEVIVQPKTRLPSPVRRIRFDTIVALAPQSTGLDTGKAIAIGAATGAASFLALFLIIWATLDN
jgi:hypothetical protein